MSIYTILSSIKHNSHYLNRYIRFIELCDGSGEIKHHICPKAKDMFPQYSSLKEHNWNCALLTERQHFIAHWMLWKAYRNRPMTGAFNLMNNFLEYTMTSRVYEGLRRDVSKPRGPRSQETKDKLRKANLGHRHSDEAKTKIGASSKGNTHSLGKMHSIETKLKMSNAHRNPSNETRAKMSLASSSRSEETLNKLRGPQLKVQCPHCPKIGGISAMKRTHFDNCKFQ